jgi:hypothetical protein
MITERLGTQAGRTSRTGVVAVGKAGWQTRPHEGLRHPLLPGRELSPNQAYAVQVARAGYLPVPLSGQDYIELLPSTWRTINAYGILINHRTYDCAELGPLRRQKSASSAMQGRWEVHYDPYDLSRIWVRGTGGWITVPWTQAPVVNVPFADFTWRYARKLVAGAHGDDTDQAAVARVLSGLLHRAGRAPGARDGSQDRRRDRIVARTAAAARDLPLPADGRLPATTARTAATTVQATVTIRPRRPWSKRSACSTRSPGTPPRGERYRRRESGQAIPADHGRRMAGFRR